MRLRWRELEIDCGCNQRGLTRIGVDDDIERFKEAATGAQCHRLLTDDLQIAWRNPRFMGVTMRPG